MTVHGHATIGNEAGIHCRPSSHIIKTVQDYPGRIKIQHEENGECDLTSMLDLMMMALTCGSEIDIDVEGPDEEAQLAKVIELFETIYDFPNAGE
jgi:phosphotransferase system HPr (HPr) family protein